MRRPNVLREAQEVVVVAARQWRSSHPNPRDITEAALSEAVDALNAQSQALGNVARTGRTRKRRR